MPAHGKFTDDIRKRIVGTLKAGNYATVAARFAGISSTTFHRWMRKGKAQAKGPFREFYNEVEQALAFAETRAVAHVVKEFEDDWRAALSYLERKFPRRWGRGRESGVAKRTAKDVADDSKSNLVVRSPEEVAFFLKFLADCGELPGVAIVDDSQEAVAAK